MDLRILNFKYILKNSTHIFTPHLTFTNNFFLKNKARKIDEK